MTTTATARCVGESNRRSFYGGTQPLGRCQRPVAFAVLSWGRHGGHSAMDLTCQPHLGGLAARAAVPRNPRPGQAPSVTVTAVTTEGLCARCRQRPDEHDPGAGCPS